MFRKRDVHDIHKTLDAKARRINLHSKEKNTTEWKHDGWAIVAGEQASREPKRRRRGTEKRGRHKI
ncbi:hypothetical protein [Mesorhizobium sp.]|nr:hypothetical protein [Mesorhizobium sp.]